jgi:hypothetical protein
LPPTEEYYNRLYAMAGRPRPQKKPTYKDKYNELLRNPLPYLENGSTRYNRSLKYYGTKAAIEEHGLDQDTIAPNYKYIDLLIENEAELREQYGDRDYEKTYAKYYKAAEKDIDRINEAVKLKKSGYSADILQYLPEGTVLNYSDDEEDQLRRVLNLAPKSFDAKAIHSTANKIRKEQAEETGQEYYDTNPYASLFGDAALTEEQLIEDLKIINSRYGLKSPIDIKKQQEYEAYINSPEAHASPRLWIEQQRGEYGKVENPATPEETARVLRQFQAEPASEYDAATQQKIAEWNAQEQERTERKKQRSAQVADFIASLGRTDTDRFLSEYASYKAGEEYWGGRKDRPVSIRSQQDIDNYKKFEKWLEDNPAPDELLIPTQEEIQKGLTDPLNAGIYGYVTGVDLGLGRGLSVATGLDKEIVLTKEQLIDLYKNPPKLKGRGKAVKVEPKYGLLFAPDYVFPRVVDGEIMYVVPPNNETLEMAQANNPLAFGIGNVVGSLPTVVATGGAAMEATAALPAVAGRAIAGGIPSAVRGMSASMAEGEGAGEVILNTLGGFATGAAGGAASYGVEHALGTALQNAPAWIQNAVANAGGSLAYSGIDIGGRALMTLATGDKIDWNQELANIPVDIIFDIIMGGKVDVPNNRKKAAIEANIKNGQLDINGVKNWYADNYGKTDKTIEPLIIGAGDTEGTVKVSPAARQAQTNAIQQQQGIPAVKPPVTQETPSAASKIPAVTPPEASFQSGTKTKNISDTKQAYEGRNFRIAPEKPATIQTAAKTSKDITPISKIISDLSAALDVPVTSSRMKRSLKTKAQGYYDVHPEVILSRQSNDIQTVMHEIGHHLDKKYKFSSTDPAKLQNILAKMPDGFKKTYSPSELNGEAVAEFMKHYIINPTEAKRLDADFYDLFEKTLSKEDMAAIKDAQRKTIQWYNADIWKRTGTTIQSYSEKPKKTFTDAYRRAKAFLVDEFQQLGVFDRAAKERGYTGDISVERLARNSKYAPEAAQFIVEDYMSRPDGTLVTENGQKVDGLLKNIKGLSTEEFDNLSIYMKNKHALDWAAQGKRVFSDDFDLNEIQDAVKAFEANNPELVKRANEIYKWWNSFIEEWYVKTGLLPKAVYDTWKKKYPHYVPNYRVSERQAVAKGVNRGFSGQQSHIKAAKGSFKNTYNPIESLMRDVGRIVNIVKRAQVFRAIDKVAKSTEGLGDFVRRVDRDLVYQKFDTTDIKEKITDKFNKMLNDPNAATDIMDEVLDDTLENFIPKKFTNDTSIFSGIDENGKIVWYEVMDPMFIEALHGLETEKLPAVLNAVAKFNRGLKRAITGSNPLFTLASNLWRDLGEAFVFGSQSNPFKYIHEQLQAYKDIIKKTDAYMRFKAMGGTGDYVGTVTRPDTLLKTINDTMKKPSIIDIPKKMFNAMEKFNNAIEAAPRLAEFKRTQAAEVKKGSPDAIASEKAMRAAMEVTVDFRIKGKSSATLDSIFLFYNAGMQGTYKFTRAIGGALKGGAEAKRRLWGILGKSVVAFALAQIGLDIWNYSVAPEKRALLPKYITDNYYVLYVGGKEEFVRIPKAQTLFNSILGGASERAFNSLVHGQDLAIDSYFAGLVDDVNPLRSDVFSPIVDVAANKTWYETPIVSARLEKLPEAMQYDAKTSEISKLVGQTFNISPKKVEYLIKQYTGGVGQVALPITTGEEGLGNFFEMLTRRMTVNPAFTNDVIDGYYDNIDWMEKLIAGYKADGSIMGKSGEQAKKLYETADTLLNGKVLKRDKNGDVSKRGESVLKDGKKQIAELWKEEQAAKTEEEKIKIRYKIINLCGVLNNEIERFKEFYIHGKEVYPKLPPVPKIK